MNDSLVNTTHKTRPWRDVSYAIAAPGRDRGKANVGYLAAGFMRVLDNTPFGWVFGLFDGDVPLRGCLTVGVAIVEGLLIGVVFTESFLGLAGWIVRTACAPMRTCVSRHAPAPAPAPAPPCDSRARLAACRSAAPTAAPCRRSRPST